MYQVLYRFAGIIVSFGSHVRLLSDRLIGGVFLRLPKFAPMSFALLIAPLPTAVQLLVRAGRRMPKTWAR